MADHWKICKNTSKIFFLTKLVWLYSWANWGFKNFFQRRERKKDAKFYYFRFNSPKIPVNLTGAHLESQTFQPTLSRWQLKKFNPFFIRTFRVICFWPNLQKIWPKTKTFNLFWIKVEKNVKIQLKFFSLTSSSLLINCAHFANQTSSGASSNPTKWGKIHCVGHSLGVHICSYMSKQLKRRGLT